jgi:hypothetical protein
MSVGLPAIPLVPVSSTQVVVGSVVGIGLVKGAREIKLKALGEIAAGWVVTPLAAGFLTYIALFFVQNVFKLPVFSGKVQDTAIQPDTVTAIAENATEINLILPAILTMSALAIIILIFLVFRQQKLRLKTENELLHQQNNYYQAQKTLSGMEVTAVHLENSLLSQKLETKRREYVNIALNISSQREFLQSVAAKIDEIRLVGDQHQLLEQLNELSLMVKQKMNFSDETEELYAQIELIHKDFRQKLTASFPGLTEQEKRLAVLLRLNFSSKEIASLMGISPKSAEIARYRLRKKLNLKQGESLTQFIHNL